MEPAVCVNVVNICSIIEQEASNVQTSLQKSNSERCSALRVTKYETVRVFYWSALKMTKCQTLRKF